jgi:hypothetical protein
MSIRSCGRATLERAKVQVCRDRRLRSVTLNPAHSSSAWVSSYAEISQLVNEIGTAAPLTRFLGAGAMYLQRNTAVGRLVARKKGDAPAPF